MTFLQSLRRSPFIPFALVYAMLASFMPKPARADDAAPPAQGQGGTGGFDTSIAASAAGASKGTGSALNVDTASGTMQTSIPFESPKARGALQPGLALSYSSAAGLAGGLAGAGWGFSVGAIERRPRSGMPRYKDPANGALLDPAVEDQFVFNGRALAALGLVGVAQEEGIPSFATGGGWTYFRLVNDDFTRFFWSPDHRTWIVQFKAGETWELGVPLSVTYANAADQTEALDVDRQIEPGKAFAPPFRWNLAVRYDAQGGFGHAVNRIVYRWAHLDTNKTLADLGSLVDVYDTPNVASADSKSTDPAIFAHHIHFAYKSAHALFTAATPVWRAAPIEVLDHVDVTTAEDGRAARSLLHRYSMNYTADAKNPEAVRHLVSVGIEGRCATPLLEQNTLVPTTTPCAAQPQVPTFTYTSQTPFATQTTAAQIVTSTALMPVKGAIPDGTAVLVNPYLYDVNGDGFADIVYGDNDGSAASLTGITRQWVSTDGKTFASFDNIVGPLSSFLADGFAPFQPGDFSGLAQLSVMVPPSTGFPPSGRPFSDAYPVVTPVQVSPNAWHWAQQTVSVQPSDPRTTTANPSDTAPYSSGNPPAEGTETRAERTFAITDIDGDGYLDELTATDIDEFGWVYTARWPSGPTYFEKGFHRRLGTLLALRSTQKDAASMVNVFSDYAPDRGVDHYIHAPASNIAVPPAPLTGTQYVGRLDGNLKPFSVDPFWSPTDKANWHPPAEAPLDASLMYNDPFFTDMNGDGIVDWVVVPPGKSKKRLLWYWPGHGDGSFGECGSAGNCSTAYSGTNAVAMLLPDVEQSALLNGPLGAPPAWPADPERIVRDVTGDGFADLIMLQPSGIDVYRNINGAGFSPTVTSHTDKSLLGSGYDILPRTCPDHVCAYFGNYVPKTHLSFADPYGSGHDSMVVLSVVNDGSNASNAYRVESRAIDILGAQPVGLLETHRNGAGITTKVTYETTTHQAQSALLPTSLTGPWTRTMATVRHVVGHIETTNNLPGTLEERHATDYAYQDPVYGGRDHVFRGFRKAVQFDRDDANRNGVITATSYLTGLCEADPGTWTQACVLQSPERPIDALRGLPWMTEVYAYDGTYRSTVVNRYEVRTTQQQFLDKRRAHYVVPIEKHTYLYDGTKPGSSSRVLMPVATILDPSSPTKNESDQWVTVHGSGRGGTSAVAHLLTRSEFDARGNPTDIWDDGQVGVDDSVHTTLQWQRFGSDWTWRLTHRHVDALPAATAGGDRDLDVTYDYDAFGNTKAVHSPLAGSMPAPRFHETGREIADPPANASVDGREVYAQYVTFDAYGNVIKKMKGTGNGCVSVIYDDAFNLFPKSESTFSLLKCKGTSFTTSMKYDWGAGQPLLVVNVAGATATKTYDAFGRLLTVVRPDATTGAPMSAAALKLTYFDATDNPVHAVQATTTDAVTGAASSSWTYTEPFGHELATIRPADATTDGKPWIVDAVTLRDLNGRPVAKYDPYFWAGPPSATIYPVSTAAAAKRITSDAFGRPTSTLGRDGLQDARWVYHPLATDAYDAEQLRGKHLGSYTTTLKDGHGRTSSVTERFHDAAGALQSVVTTTLYTARGFPRSLTKGAMPPHLFLYDSLGRVVSNLEPNTTRDTANHRPSWTYTYDDDGNLVGTTDARGCGENLYYDTNGRLLAEDYSPCLASQLAHSKPNLTTGDGTEAFYEYDKAPAGAAVTGMTIAWLGKLSQISDRASRTRFGYDMRGRATRVDRQVAAPGSPAMALASRYAPTWSTKTMTFDDRDRPVTESTGADVAALLPASGAGSFTTIAYSPRGTPSAITSTYASTPLVKSHQLDADDFLRVVTYGDLAATTVKTTPDPVLRTLAGVDVTRNAPSSWSGGGFPLYSSPAGAFTTQTTLESVALKPDLIGNPVTISDNRDTKEWPDGAKPVDKTLVYDDLYRLTGSASVYKAAYKGKAGTDQQVSPFAAELANNASAKKFLVPSPQLTRQTSESFTYDAVGNVTKSSDDANAFFDRSLGNITNGTPSSAWGPHQITHAQGTSSDQLLDASYDVAGNLQLLTVAQSCPEYNGACQHRFEYTWNEVGQLDNAKRWDLPSLLPGIIPRSIDPKTPPATDPNADLAFAYDASGTRVLKSSYDAGALAGTTVTIFPSLRLEHAAWKSGDYERTTDTEAVYLTAGGKSFGRVVYSQVDPVLSASGSIHVFLEISDPLGSTSVVIDKATGELVERTTYSAYGNTDSDYRPARWQSFRESYRFTGQEDDAEVGLTYFGARYYAPQLGRFISADPLAVHTTRGDPNPYAYVRGHASNAIDPDGLDGGCLSEMCIPSMGPGEFAAGTVFTMPTTVIPVGPNPAIASYMAAQGAVADPDFSNVGDINWAMGEETGAGATWESKSLALESWNPNATYETQAMLLGSHYDMSWAKLNPEAYAVSQQVGLFAVSYTPILSQAILISEAMDSTRSAGERWFAGGMAIATILPVGRIASKAARLGVDIYYGARGVEATLTAEMIGTGTRAASRIRPPGFLGEAAGHARGHLLGRNLGGSGTEARNLVTLFQNPTNTPVMSGIERQIANAVKGGETVNFGAMPIYAAGRDIPLGVTIVAEGSNGFSLALTVLNR